MGGDCLNVGCVPSKALIAAGELAQGIREGARFGIGRSDPQVNMARVREHVRGVIAAIAPNDSAERFTALGVRVIKAEARFTGPDTVAAGDLFVQARPFPPAPGSPPPPGPRPPAPPTADLSNKSAPGLSSTPP